MKRICKQCGVEFTLSPEEIAFYQSKNLQLPKRCEHCRRENKTKAESEQMTQTVKPYYGKKHDGGKWWAAAAAVLVLLIAGIGVFQSGRLFERDVTGKRQEVSAETMESPSAVADGQAELSADDSAAKESEHFADISRTEVPITVYSFRKAEYLQEHFERHGAEFGYSSADEYLAGANRVIASSEALHKLEAEDGDDVYYLEATNEFVIVSTDGYLRTYFKPEDGKAYYDRQ